MCLLSQFCLVICFNLFVFYILLHLSNLRVLHGTFLESCFSLATFNDLIISSFLVALILITSKLYPYFIPLQWHHIHLSDYLFDYQVFARILILNISKMYIRSSLKIYPSYSHLSKWQFYSSSFSKQNLGAILDIFFFFCFPSQWIINPSGLLNSKCSVFKIYP